MNLRWLWLDFLPKGMDLTAGRKADVRRRAREGMKLGGREGMGAFVIAVVLLVPWLLISRWLTDQATVLGLPSVTALPVVLLGFWIIGVLAVGPVIARATYRELRRAGHDVCVHCGHRWPDAAIATVTGPDADPDQCPDCGNPRRRPV